MSEANGDSHRRLVLCSFTCETRRGQFAGTFWDCDRKAVGVVVTPGWPDRPVCKMHARECERRRAKGAPMTMRYFEVQV